MDAETILEIYHQLKPLELLAKPFYTKGGTRLNLEVLRPFLKYLANVQGDVLDASGGGIASIHSGIAIESSRAALRCLEKSGIKTLAGAVWDAPKESFDAVVCLPATDKGNAQVLAELKGTYNALRLSGEAFFLMHKDQGAKRYEAQAKDIFGNLEVVSKNAGWRLSKVVKENREDYQVNPISFEVLGLSLIAEPGVYAAGKLDPGTAFLLESIDLSNYANKSLLDMGCGYGLIALKAAMVGAIVTALDDDLLAVRSTQQNAKNLELDIHCIHSDVDSELADQLFDAVLMNPPFHIGKQVLLEVPTAFIAAAYKHLKPGGELILVANKALGYEKLLERFSSWHKVAENQQFKVLRAIK